MLIKISRSTYTKLFMVEILGETNWLKLPTPAKHHSNYFHALFYNRRSCWGHGTDKPPTGRVKERKKGDATCPLTSQNPSHLHPSWLSNTCANRKDPMSEWLDRENHQPCDGTVLPVSLGNCSPPGCLLPIKPPLYQRMCLLRQFISEC